MAKKLFTDRPGKLSFSLSLKLNVSLNETTLTGPMMSSELTETSLGIKNKKPKTVVTPKARLNMRLKGFEI